jgi:hypothetical protein
MNAHITPGWTIAPFGDGTRERTVPLDSIRADAPVVHVPGFLSRDYARQLAAVFSRLELVPYVVTVGAASGAAYYYGANLYDARPDASVSADKYDEYFANARSDRDRLDALVAEAGLAHPLTDILIPQIEKSLGKKVRVAEEGDGRTYYTPVVRSTSNGIHHHNDDGPREAPELIIGQVVTQRSMLLFLETPGDGSGQLEVFHKRPTDEDRDEHARVEYGYTLEAVEDGLSTVVIPGPGDLVVFDAWNIHRVHPSSPGSLRVTVSTFYGELPDGSVIVWS